MKKIKYLLFIIPLLFIFIGNIKAFTFIEHDGVTYNEEYVYNAVKTAYPDFDYSTHDKVICTGYYTDSNFTTLSSFDCMFLLSSFELPSLSSDQTTYISSDGYLFQLSSSFVVSTNYFPNNFSGIISAGRYNRLSRTNFEIDYCYYPACVQDDLDFSFLLQPEEPEPEESTIENKIYLPDELVEGSCPIILNKDTIRIYESKPVSNTPVNFTDYFINSHYIKQTGQETLTDTVSCLNLEDFTTAYVYRFDFDKIIIIFVSILFLIAYPVMKIIHAFFIGFKIR